MEGAAGVGCVRLVSCAPLHLASSLPFFSRSRPRYRGEVTLPPGSCRSSSSSSSSDGFVFLDHLIFFGNASTSYNHLIVFLLLLVSVSFVPAAAGALSASFSSLMPLPHLVFSCLLLVLLVVLTLCRACCGGPSCVGHHVEVVLQQRGGEEGALGAGVVLLVGVDVQVAAQHGALPRRVGAVRAGEGAVAGVRAGVRLEVTPLGGAVGALGAGEGLLAGVLADVHLEILLGAGGVGAEAARVRLLARVDPHVPLEEPTPLEGRRADRAGKEPARGVGVQGQGSGWRLLQLRLAHRRHATHHPHARHL